MTFDEAVKAIDQTNPELKVLQMYQDLKAICGLDPREELYRILKEEADAAAEEARTLGYILEKLEWAE